MDSGFTALPTPWLLLLAVGSSLFLWARVAGPRRDAKEPVYLAPIIPVIGHIIGLATKRSLYWHELYKKSKLDIFGLVMPGMPGGRVYIVNSPDLRAAVLRAPQKFSARYVEARYTPALAGLSPGATKTLAHYVEVGEQGQSYLKEGMEAVQRCMNLGEPLTSASRVAVQKLAGAVAALEEDGPAAIDLQRWIIDTVSVTATDSIWGPKNPYRDPEIQKGFWDFQDKAGVFMSMPMAKHLCAGAYAGRERVIDAFVKYYADEGNTTASRWIQENTRISNRYDVSDRDKGAMDVANTHGLLANTTPTSFWTLYHVFSDPSVLAEVRAAVQPFVTTSSTDGRPSHEMDLRDIRSVPILRSVLHEVLRYYANSVGTRAVVEDTMLAGRYLLKKDTFIIMPNRACHFDEPSWGSTTSDFDARRFVTIPNPRAGFVGFGGGINMCPGRFFAQNQVLALCAMMALRFDITPRGGSWVHPSTDDHDMTVNVHPPKHTMLVDVMPREEWQGEWTVRL